jgi:hypothetical protein
VRNNDAGDADTGPNNDQNYPVLNSARTDGAQIDLAGTLNSTANTRFRIEFFSSSAADPTGYGEGQRCRAHGRRVDQARLLRLDLDHVGAHVAQQHGAVGAGDVARDVEHTHAIQRVRLRAGIGRGGVDGGLAGGAVVLHRLVSSLSNVVGMPTVPQGRSGFQLPRPDAPRSLAASLSSRTQAPERSIICA